MDEKMDELMIGNALFRQHVKDHNRSKNRLIAIVSVLAALVSAAVTYLTGLGSNA